MFMTEGEPALDLWLEECYNFGSLLVIILLSSPWTVLKEDKNLGIKATCIMHTCIPFLQGKKGWTQLTLQVFFLANKKNSSLEYSSVAVHISWRAENPLLGRSSLLLTNAVCYCLVEQSSSQKISLLSLFIQKVIQCLRDSIYYFHICFHSQDRTLLSCLNTRISPWHNSENLAIQLARKPSMSFCARSYKTLMYPIAGITAK